MFYKFSATQDWDFGIEAVSIVTDKQSLTKRASARELLKYAKTKGQTDLHVIAVGAYEGTGFNRNLDMFKEADCRANHHYFRDADRAVHRHHKNKPESPKYGNIKAAAYNEPMRRIELIVGLDDDKCGDIIQEQEKKGSTNWSMASKQAYDICSWCKHKAYTDDDRCEHIPDKLGEINKVGEMCGMENPNPKWFEISYVSRPADRIGMSLAKCASHSGIRPMLPSDYLNIYTEFTPPADDFFISKKASDKRELARKCAAIEKHVEATCTKTKKIIPKPTIVAEKMAAEDLDAIRKLDPARFFKYAADKGIILSPENFAAYVFGGRIKEAAIQGLKNNLRSIFQEIEKEGGDVFNNERYDIKPTIVTDTVSSRLFTKLANAHSIHPAYTANRLNIVKESCIVDENPSDASFNKELAKQYIAYKLAAINYLNEQGKLTEDILLNVVLQNNS